jgi:hypothetical protein
MNYFLVHIGSSLPSHLIHCLRQITYVDSESKIVLCTDSNIKFDDSRVEVVNKNDLDLPNTGDYFCEERDPLWLTSLQRIFLLNAYVKQTMESVIHFDNDVLLYNSDVDTFDQLADEVYITPQKPTEYVFGFSLIKNKDKFNDICTNIYNAVLKGKQYVLSQTGDQAHEMRLLHHYGKDSVTNLPIHPSLGTIQNTIFDPGSYGQHIGGTNIGHPPGFIDKDHIVGSFLGINTKAYMSDNGPVVEYNNQTFKLNNLHVHSKKLDLFITYDK